jgi:NitT/TauT family transport system substrate-binding protein
MFRPIGIVFGVLIASMSCAVQAESLKVSISQQGFWDSSFVDFALREGFFKEVGLEVEPFYTEGGAQTLATVISGSVDIGLSNGMLGLVGAYTKGAPIRVVSAQMTGANELYWYVKADTRSPRPARLQISFCSRSSRRRIQRPSRSQPAASHPRTPR